MVLNYNFNLRKELLLDPDQDHGEDTAGSYNELLPFILATAKKSLKGLQLLMSAPINHLWSATNLLQVASLVKCERWT